MAAGLGRVASESILEVMAAMRIRRPIQSPPTEEPRGRKLRPSVLRRWKQHLIALRAFKRKHGHCNVPRIYPQNQPLAAWVAYVRQRKKHGELDPELTGSLEELGLSWVLTHRSVPHYDWDAMVVSLAAFRQEHGHCRVTHAKNPQLATWLVGVRRRKRKGLLEPRRIRQLEKLGFEWEPRAAGWEKKFAALVQYKAQHGHCNVPFGPNGNSGLRNWVDGLRRSYQCGALARQKVEQLEEIGFQWRRTFPRMWDANYAALIEYQRKHGHCRVSTLDQGYAGLGCWVRTQRGKRRKSKLTAEQIQRLDAIGFEWEVPRR